MDAGKNRMKDAKLPRNELFQHYDSVSHWSESIDARMSRFLTEHWKTFTISDFRIQNVVSVTLANNNAFTDFKRLPGW